MQPHEYGAWNQNALTLSKNITPQFKTTRDTTFMLEHVSVDDGKRYLQRIQNEYNLTDYEVSNFCSKNDNIGGAQRHRYTDSVIVSPSSLRYLFHAFKIMDLNPLSIVEVGGGYGGLALLLFAVAEWKGVSFKSYIIYDLPGPVALQRSYLKIVGHDNFIEWRDAISCASDFNEIGFTLVATYSISEFDRETSDAYISNLIPKVNKYFFAWNSRHRNPLLSLAKEVPEDPQTGAINVLLSYETS